MQTSLSTTSKCPCRFTEHSHRRNWPTLPARNLDPGTTQMLNLSISKHMTRNLVRTARLLRASAPPQCRYGAATRWLSTRVTGTRPLRVLAVESSADDACAAVVTSDREILANVVCKQHDVNAEFGGIHPIKAQETHMVDVVSGPGRGGVRGCGSGLFLAIYGLYVADGSPSHKQSPKRWLPQSSSSRTSMRSHTLADRG